MITVAALFTQNTGEPATGLTLADIDLYLYRRAKATGAVTTVWTAQNPTEEVGGGLYTRAYTGEDVSNYQYYGYAEYTGVAVLDTNFALQDAVFTVTSPAGATAQVYTVTYDGAPLAGVYCWMTTDAAGTVIVDAGTTNALGQVTFHHDLASGTTVYIWRTLAGYEFSDPDTEVIP